MKMILRGIDAVKGDISDKTALVNAMLNVDMSDNPAGPVTMDKKISLCDCEYLHPSGHYGIR